MENEALVPRLTSIWSSQTRKEYVRLFLLMLLILVCISLFIGLCIYGTNLEYETQKQEENYVPNISITSMDFTVLNITETRLSAKWDLLIRIPPDLPGYYTCLQGDFQFSIMYKDVTIATSSIESYNLRPWWPQVFRVSLINDSEGDMDSVIMKDIMKDIKEIGEIRFGSRLLLPDCRYGTSGKMNYSCDEATLRFEHGSQRNATLFGNHPTCIYLRL